MRNKAGISESELNAALLQLGTDYASRSINKSEYRRRRQEMIADFAGEFGWFEGEPTDPSLSDDLAGIQTVRRPPNVMQAESDEIDDTLDQEDSDHEVASPGVSGARKPVLYFSLFWGVVIAGLAIAAYMVDIGQQ